MKYVSIEELCKTDYYVKVISYITLMAQPGKKFSCMNHPKAHHLLRYVHKSTTLYSGADEKNVYAADGEVIYTPKGSRYEVETFDIEDGSASFQIIFLIYDENGNEIRLCEGDSTVFHSAYKEKVKDFFEKMSLSFDGNQALPTERNILLTELINFLGTSDNAKNHTSAINNGIVYLQSHYAENPSIRALAQMCSLSEEYFRRIFKKEMGISPCKYKNKLRMSKAIDYLIYGETSVEEMSALLGYATVSHFIKEFKKYYGMSPIKYKNDLFSLKSPRILAKRQ